MKPKYNAGDLVSDWECSHNGIIVGVVPSNWVPDATVRGLGPDVFGWMYYVLFNNPPLISGPLRSSELTDVL